MVKNNFTPPRANTHKLKPAPKMPAPGLAQVLSVLCLSWLCLASPNAFAEAEPLTTCTAEPTEMTLSPGDVVACKFTVGDQDVFYFQGKANSTVLVQQFSL